VLVAEPDTAVVLITTAGMSAKGVKLEDRACWICKIEGGQLKEVDNYCDTAALNQ
jgi:ketosteroid isomerase-like protein